MYEKLSVASIYITEYLLSDMIDISLSDLESRLFVVYRARLRPGSAGLRDQLTLKLA